MVSWDWLGTADVALLEMLSLRDTVDRGAGALDAVETSRDDWGRDRSSPRRWNTLFVNFLKELVILDILNKWESAFSACPAPHVALWRYCVTSPTGLNSFVVVSAGNSRNQTPMDLDQDKPVHPS